MSTMLQIEKEIVGYTCKNHKSIVRIDELLFNWYGLSSLFTSIIFNSVLYFFQVALMQNDPGYMICMKVKDPARHELKIS